VDSRGRCCPRAYRYQPEALAVPAQRSADVVDVVGGLDGDLAALRAVLERADHEPCGPRRSWTAPTSSSPGCGRRRRGSPAWCAAWGATPPPHGQRRRAAGRHHPRRPPVPGRLAAGPGGDATRRPAGAPPGRLAGPADHRQRPAGLVRPRRRGRVCQHPHRPALRPGHPRRRAPPAGGQQRHGRAWQLHRQRLRVLTRLSGDPDPPPAASTAPPSARCAATRCRSPSTWPAGRGACWPSGRPAAPATAPTAAASPAAPPCACTRQLAPACS
jgi:hypothetical protein